MREMSRLHTVIGSRIRPMYITTGIGSTLCGCRSMGSREDSPPRLWGIHIIAHKVNASVLGSKEVSSESLAQSGSVDLQMLHLFKMKAIIFFRIHIKGRF